MDLSNRYSASESFWYLAVGTTRTIFSLISEHWQGHAPSGRTGAFVAKVDMSNMLSQDQSWLLCLPFELRLRIFDFALSNSDDLSKPCDKGGVYLRPDRRVCQTSHTSLLRTCKRVYQETRLMPVAITEHTFWLGSKGVAGQWRAWQHCLNQDQRAAVQHMRFHTDSMKLYQLGLGPGLCTKQVSLVIRAAKESGSAQCPQSLAICPWLRGQITTEMMDSQPREPDLRFLRQRMDSTTWGGQICQIEGIQVLRIELEVDKALKDGLARVLERAPHWRFPIPGSHDALVYAGGRDVAAAPHTTYLVSEMTWRRQTGEEWAVANLR